MADCKQCEIGKYQNAMKQTFCKLCPEGFLAAFEGQSMCDQCPVGWIQPNIGESICNECPIGRKEVNTRKVCEKCPAGKYQSESGKNMCEMCPGGYWQNIDESSGCKTCVAGKYSASSGRTTNCDNCPVGRVSSKTARTDACDLCAEGKYQEQTGQSSSCKECPYGWYQSSKGGSSCTNCPGGRACTKTGGLGALCADGKYRESSTYGSCKSCAAEKGSVNQNTGCDWCSPGQSTRGESGTSCKTCSGISRGWKNQALASVGAGGNKVRMSKGRFTSCPFSCKKSYNPPSCCGGHQGRLTLTTYVVQKDTDDHSTYWHLWKVHDTDDWSNVKVECGRSGTGTTVWSKSFTYTKKGGGYWVEWKTNYCKITYIMDEYWGNIDHKFYLAFVPYKYSNTLSSTQKAMKLAYVSNYEFYQDNPGSMYCTAPNRYKSIWRL